MSRVVRLRPNEPLYVKTQSGAFLCEVYRDNDRNVTVTPTSTRYRTQVAPHIRLPSK